MSKPEGTLVGVDTEIFIKAVKAIRTAASDIDYAIYAWDLPEGAGRRLRDVQHNLETLAIGITPDHKHEWRRKGTQYVDDLMITVEWMCGLTYCAAQQKTTTRIEKPS